MKLVVPGGNGFIGAEICRIAVQNGHDVAAFGRSGRPALSPAEEPWAHEVEWRAADVFVPEAWRDLLEGADAVIHLISTLYERPQQGITYDRVNAESVAVAAQEAVEADVDAFVFFSVKDNPPIVPNAFLTAKRRAEQELSDAFPDLRSVRLRPNLVYGPRKQGSSTLAAVLQHIQDLGLTPYASEEGRPLPVEIVAASAVHAATTDTVEGVLSVPQIDDLGRTSGLVDPDTVSESSLIPLLLGLGGTALAIWLLRRWGS